LIDRELSQSDCIKLGYGIESVMKDYILSKNERLINIKSTNKKGQKEKDHLFKDEIAKTIYYAELKSNLNLDTEKCKSTTEKCLFLERELSIENPNYNVKMFLVNNRYLHKDVIPNAIMKKYNRIENNVVGTCDYFEALGVHFPFSREEEYTSWLNYLADMMFTDNKEII
jgi:DNA mismatch repair ATPase MutL